MSLAQSTNPQPRAVTVGKAAARLALHKNGYFFGRLFITPMHSLINNTGAYDRPHMAFGLSLCEVIFYDLNKKSLILFQVMRLFFILMADVYLQSLFCVRVYSSTFGELMPSYLAMFLALKIYLAIMVFGVTGYSQKAVEK